MRYQILLTGMSVAMLFTVGAHAQEGDATAGATVFKKCSVCHVADSDKNKVGPSLINLFGRTAGTHPGFKLFTGHGRCWQGGSRLGSSQPAGISARSKGKGKRHEDGFRRIERRNRDLQSRSLSEAVFKVIRSPSTGCRRLPSASGSLTPFDRATDRRDLLARTLPRIGNLLHGFEQIPTHVGCSLLLA